MKAALAAALLVGACVWASADEAVDAAFAESFALAAQLEERGPAARAYAWLAWGALQAGRPADAERALEAGVAQLTPWPEVFDREEGEASARLGAVQLGLDRPAAERFARVLVPYGPTSRAWFEAAADGGLHRSAEGRALVARALRAAEPAEVPLRERASALSAAAPALGRMGLEALGIDACRALLQEPALDLFAAEELGGALHTWSGVALPEAERKLLWDLLDRANPAKVDEFVVPLVCALVRSAPEDLQLAELYAGKLRKAGAFSAAWSVDFARVLGRAEGDAAPRFADELAHLIDRAWTHPGSTVGAAEPRPGLSPAETERMRLLYTALRLVPRCMPEGRALAVARDGLRKTQEAGAGVFFQAELYGACAEVCGAFPGSAAALEVLQQLVDAALQASEAPEAGGAQPALALEGAARCVKALAARGTKEERALLQRVQRFARGRLSRALEEDSAGPEVWFSSVLLVECDKALRERAPTASRGLRSWFLGHLRAYDPYDRAELVASLLESCGDRPEDVLQLVRSIPPGDLASEAICAELAAALGRLESR